MDKQKINMIIKCFVAGEKFLIDNQFICSRRLKWVLCVCALLHAHFFYNIEQFFLHYLLVGLVGYNIPALHFLQYSDLFTHCHSPKFPLITCQGFRYWTFIRRVWFGKTFTLKHCDDSQIRWGYLCALSWTTLSSVRSDLYPLMSTTSCRLTRIPLFGTTVFILLLLCVRP